VTPSVDALYTRSLEAPRRRKPLSDQTTNTLPAPSIAAVGSAPERRPPASVWCRTSAMVTTSVQLLPPSVERKAPTALSLALLMGTITVPFGWTSGWPPRPASPDAVVRLGPQVSPPSVEVLIWIRFPAEFRSHSV